MKSFSPKISFYIVRAILPYFGFAWLLLSVILFVQQASRYSDIFFNNSIPSLLIWQLTFALLPNVIAFTCPMAVLIGVIIGLTKMQSDNELVAIRAAGVGSLQISFPIIILGILLSLFAFLINLKGVPFAARIVRKVAIQTAYLKLESPIEPGVFNTEVQGFTIYVKDADLEKGKWKNIFIYQEDKKNNQVRLITSKNGRIDNLIKEGGFIEKSEDSELVLENATVNTFSLNNLNQKLVSEVIKESRIPIQTKRKELAEKLVKSEETPEELGLKELANYAKSKFGQERTEAELLWQRRILLSITPLIFALLGTSLVLRFSRGGRGWGIFLALISLIAYYLVAFLGEQLARTDKISVVFSGLIPIVSTSLAIFWFFLSQHLFLTRTRSYFQKITIPSIKNFIPFNSNKKLFTLSTRILDYDIVTSLIKYFLLTLSFLSAIYLIFTAFELLKFAGNIDNGFKLLFKYLFFLLPFIYIQIAPSALMIATLATYFIKSRQNEVVTWTAAGQSIYRLLFPCFVLMMVIGAGNWLIQEKIAPNNNQTQDLLRSQIRNKGIMVLNTGRKWVATDNRIYSFELADSREPESKTQNVKNLSIFEFSESEVKLESVIKVTEAAWEDNRIKFFGKVDQTVWKNGIPQNLENSSNLSEIKESYNPFNQLPRKPNHLTSTEIADYIDKTDSESEKRIYSVALEKRHATLFLPLIITLFTAPFALTLSRQGKVMTISYAIGIWLVFMGLTSLFEQYGISGGLSPMIAVWSPIILFGFIGTILLTKVKT
ncbi:MAG: LptF/LptG family permease [Pyrinomonadaceae bacterium]|nr:LptF/LptG family permease [Pyrinomonadaceae bacterium]